MTIYEIDNEGDSDIIEDQDYLLEILSDMRSLNDKIDCLAEVVRVDLSLITWFVSSYGGFCEFLKSVKETDVKRRLTDFAVSRGLETELNLRPGITVDIDINFENERRLKLQAKKHFQGTGFVLNWC